jgi:hypothetical protein
LREKSSNLVDLRAEKSAKRRSPAGKWQYGFKKQAGRRPLKRNDFGSIFPISL